MSYPNLWGWNPILIANDNPNCAPKNVTYPLVIEQFAMESSPFTSMIKMIIYLKQMVMFQFLALNDQRVT